MYRILASGDWEITEARMPELAVVLEALEKEFIEGGYNLFVFTGDLVREFTDQTVPFAREWIGRLSPAVLLSGNHDWVRGVNTIESIFHGVEDWPAPTVIYEPCVLNFEGYPLAFLPAPDREAIGAKLGIQGPRERDAELSKILDYHLANLAGSHTALFSASKVPLFFHATVSSTVFSGSKLGDGLTWTIDAGRLASWAAAIGGHIHNPEALVSEIADADGRPVPILYTGTVMHDNHGQKAQRFRALALSLDQVHKEPDFLTIESRPLPSVVVPIEAVLTPEGLVGADGDLYRRLAPGRLGDFIIGYLADRCGVHPFEDVVDLKIRARMPRSGLNMLPTATELMEEINASLSPGGARGRLSRLLLKKEETSRPLAAMAGPAGLEGVTALALDELFSAWLEANNLETDPGAPEARRILAKKTSKDWVVEGTLGVRMLRTRVNNFRQWADVEVLWDALEGTTAVIGDNEVGKTNIIEAALFAWYKTTPRTAGRNEGLRYELAMGATKGSVEHDWQSAGVTYRVRRALERAASGEVSCKTELFEILEDGDLRPLASGAAADKRITSIVGSFDFTVSTYYGTASEINKLAEATPARWHEIFMDALSLARFEDFRKEAAEATREGWAKVEKLKVILSDRERDLENKERRLEAWDTEENLRGELVKKEAALDFATASRNDLARQHGEIEAKIRACDKTRQEIQELKEEAQAKDEALQSLLAVRPEDPGQPPAPEGQERDVMPLEEAEQERAVVVAKVTKLKDEELTARGHLAEARGELAAWDKTIERDAATYDGLAEAFKAMPYPGPQIESKEKIAEELSAAEERTRSGGELGALRAELGQITTGLGFNKIDLAEAEASIATLTALSFPAMPCQTATDLPDLTGLCPAYKNYTGAGELERVVNRKALLLACIEQGEEKAAALKVQVESWELEERAVAARIQELRTNLSAYGVIEAREAAHRGLKEAVARLEKARADREGMAADIRLLEDVLARTREELEVATARLTFLLGELATYDRAAAAKIWTLKAGALRAWQERVVEARSELDKVGGRLAALQDSLEAEQQLRAELARIQGQDDETVRAIGALKDELLRIGHAVQAVVAGKEEIARLRADIKERDKEVDEVWRVNGGFSLLASAFHATGIPLLMIDRVLEGFEAEANRILSGTQLTVKVQRGREVGQGADKKVLPEIWVTFTDHRGTFPLVISSGEQRNALTLALRAALAKAGCEFWGTVPQVFVQDEGFGAFHGSRIPMALELIKKIAESFRSFIYITHLRAMAAAADQTILIEANEDGTARIGQIS